ncbi:MAG: hypothetical protein JO091_04220 [Acidobacteriaceae bacterium]|nr:hypothetical protein [Acidobacteriaceae bacterium]
MGVLIVAQGDGGAWRVGGRRWAVPGCLAGVGNETPYVARLDGELASLRLGEVLQVTVAFPFHVVL